MLLQQIPEETQEEVLKKEDETQQKQKRAMENIVAEAILAKAAEVELSLEPEVSKDYAKSTWTPLIKERDFHKTLQDRVNGEKVNTAEQDCTWCLNE